MTEPEDIIDLIQSASVLKRITRSGWSIAGVNSARPESVAEHTYGAIVTSILISRFFLRKGLDLDLEKVMIMATIHDLPESVTSDIPHISETPEPSLMHDLKLRTERAAAMKILSHQGTNYNELLETWEEFSQATSLEARIVKGSDLIDMLIHALNLEDSGVKPRILDEFFASAHETIELLGLDIFSDIYSILYRKHIQNADQIGL
jgi:putative hydrolase of HD superfamily